ncbi:unnamed protein product, partial [Phaeothamnion confervicola]
MAAVRLSPKRALAYLGSRLCFVDESSVMYCFGSAARITHLLPDKGDGDGAYLWEENEWAGISAVASNWRSGRVAVCPGGRVNPPIHLYTYPDKVLRCTLQGGTGLRFVDAAFCRDGSRLAAFGNKNDYLLTVWRIAPTSGSEGDLDCPRLVEAELPADMSFISFNPSNADQLCTGGPGGLLFWRIRNLVDGWVISSIEAQPIAARASSAVDESTAVAVASAGEAKADDAAAAAADEVLELEKVVSTGDGRHERFTCHCWGLDDVLWAANELGHVVCYAAATGTILREVPLGDGRPPDFHVVGLVVTLTHLIAVGSDGYVQWLAVSPSADDGVAVAFSMALRDERGQLCAAAAVACSPMFDKLVVGCANGCLHTVAVDRERHEAEPGLAPAAGGSAMLKSFHRGRVTALTSVRASGGAPGMEGYAGLVVTGGEDGAVRLWSADRGKPCGVHRFSLWAAGDAAAAGGKPGAAAAAAVAELTVPVTALAAAPGLPLLAAGLCNGALHLLFVQHSSPYDVNVISIWRRRVYHGSVSLLAFHPTLPLLAVA